MGLAPLPTSRTPRSPHPLPSSSYKQIKLESIPSNWMSQQNSSSRRCPVQRDRGRLQRKRGCGSGRTYLPSPTVSQPSASQSSASKSQEHANVAGKQGDGIATNSAHNSAPRPNSTVATSAFQATEDVGPAAELRRELEDVRKDNDELLKSVNDYKKKLSDMEFKNLEYLMDKKIRGEKIIYLEAEVAKLKQENVGLSNLVDDLNGKVVRSGKGSSKFVTKLSNSLDKEYITLATTVERMLLQWSQAEVLEIAQDQEEGVQRNWGGRVLAVKEFGLQLESPGIAMQGTLCVPMPFIAVLRSKDLFFIHSFPSYGAVLDGLVSNVLRNPRWKSFNSPPQLSAEAINVISTNQVMISKVKQHLSDTVSNRKRLVRDELFCILKYFSLKSTHDRRKQKYLRIQNNSSRTSLFLFLTASERCCLTLDIITWFVDITFMASADR